jgi:hypothetical protein
MPDFDKLFIVDCDASCVEFSVVLHQGAGPITFFSRPFTAQHLKLAAYEQELISLVQAMHHWHPYLWGHQFLVWTDHFSLKYLLDQRLSTVSQHQWISKLFGFDFTMEYWPGRLNTIDDVLSRCDTKHALEVTAELGAMCVRSSLIFAFLDNVRQATARVPDAQEMLWRLGAGELQVPWCFDGGLLLHGSRIFLPDHNDLRHQALQLAHSARHEGVQKSLHRLCSDFYIPGDQALVQAKVRTCTTCQRNKTETRQLAWLLQLLEVPSQVWADISTNFIKGLPKEEGKLVILTVVDRFLKCAHFIPLGYPYTTVSVHRAFFDGSFCSMGSPPPSLLTGISSSPTTCGVTCLAWRVSSST